jgi:MYXO-CTERM domain-containing protein
VGPAVSSSGGSTGSSADVPIPVWALGLLSAGLAGSLATRRRRLAR